MSSSCVVRCSNLADSAESVDVRQFFTPMAIPTGGVKIIGGRQGDAFVTLTSPADAFDACRRLNGQLLCGNVMSVRMSTHAEYLACLQRVRDETAEQEARHLVASTFSAPSQPLQRPTDPHMGDVKPMIAGRDELARNSLGHLQQQPMMQAHLQGAPTQVLSVPPQPPQFHNPSMPPPPSAQPVLFPSRQSAPVYAPSPATADRRAGLMLVPAMAAQDPTVYYERASQHQQQMMPHRSMDPMVPDEDEPEDDGFLPCQSDLNELSMLHQMPPNDSSMDMKPMPMTQAGPSLLDRDFEPPKPTPIVFDQSVSMLQK